MRNSIRTESSMKKLLMISYFFPPCSKVGVLRSTAWARHLPEYGWEPWIITPSPKYILDNGAEAIFEEIKDKCRIIHTSTFEPVLRARQLWREKASKAQAAVSQENVELATRKGPTSAKSLIWRLRELAELPDEHWGWIPFAVAHAWKLRKQWDVLYTTFGPPTGFVAGWIIKMLTGKPWLADFRDLWTWGGKTVFPTTLHRDISVWLEKQGVSAADVVTTTTPTQTLRLQELAPYRKTKFTTIYNGFEAFEMPQTQPPAQRGAVRIIYPGALYRGRDPRVLMEAISTLRHSGELAADRIVLEFIGRGVAYLGQIASQLDIDDCVKISGPIPHQDVLEKISQADVGLLPVGRFIGQAALPTKIFEYLACGKPILVLSGLETEPARFIKDKRVGWVLDPKNVDEAVRFVRRLVSREAFDDVSIDPKTIQCFDRKILAGQLAGILDKLVSTSEFK